MSDLQVPVRNVAQHVLVLDDDAFTLKLHVHILQEVGLSSVRAFERGGEALKSIEKESHPDLILLDLSMPEMDGIEFLRHLVPIGYEGGLVLISGEDERLLQSASRLVRAHGLRVVGHLSKPLKPAGLRALLETWQRQTEVRQRAQGKVYDREDVRRGIENREILNFYQPKVSIRTGEFTGVEALARWQHPTDGLVGPGAFIGVAEESGLAEDLTRLVFSRGVEEIRNLQMTGVALEVAINLAPSALKSVDLADFLATETARASLLPQNIVLELTESQILGDLRDSLDVLTRLRLKRFKLSIDDFGTGYSSLAQLSDLPFDELKIDRKFVHNASTDATARAIYEASLGLARRLGMKTVAEGAEDLADWEFVRGTDCDTAQGYFVARPMAPGALVEWAKGWRDRSMGQPRNVSAEGQ